jgi:hypothetical protein
MFNPIVNTIAITNGLIGLSVGTVLIMPSAMAFAAPNPKPSMILLGCSGLSVAPISVLATTMSVVTGDLIHQSIYLLPACGIAAGIIADGFNTRKEVSTPLISVAPIILGA